MRRAWNGAVGVAQIPIRTGADYSFACGPSWSPDGANIVFSLYDAFPISSAFADRLAAHLEQVDIVGIAGATAARTRNW